MLRIIKISARSQFQCHVLTPTSPSHAPPPRPPSTHSPPEPPPKAAHPHPPCSPPPRPPRKPHHSHFEMARASRPPTIINNQFRHTINNVHLSPHPPNPTSPPHTLAPRTTRRPRTASPNTAAPPHSANRTPPHPPRSGDPALFLHDHIILPPLPPPNITPVQRSSLDPLHSHKPNQGHIHPRSFQRVRGAVLSRCGG